MRQVSGRARMIVLAFLPALFPAGRPAARRAATDNQIILASPEIALGSVTPEDPSDQPRFIQEVSIVSNQPWTLQLLATDLSSTQTVSRWNAERLLWRLRGDRFRPLARNLPISLSTRPPTGPSPTTLILEFATQCDWSQSPGNYAGPLTFVLNTTPTGSVEPTYLQVVAPVRLTVAAYGSMRVVGSTIGSPPVDPTRSDSFAYEPISVAIRANAGWSLSAEPLDDFTDEKGSRRLPAGILSVLGSLQLKRQTASPLASGGPTGNTDVGVLLHLMTNLTGGEAAGQYKLPFRLVLSVSGTGPVF